MKKLITERELESLQSGDSFQVSAEMILTPSARDIASRRGIKLVWPQTGGGVASSAGESALEQAIREAVTAELGEADPELVAAVSGAMTGSPMQDDPAARVLRDMAVKKAEAGSRAVLSAMGRNSTGILGRLTQAVSATGGDIQDVSQSIVGGFFTLILIVDLDGLAPGKHFDDFRAACMAALEELGLVGMVAHEDVLAAMHRV